MLAPRTANASAIAFTTRATPWISAWRNTEKGRNDPHFIEPTSSTTLITRAASRLRLRDRHVSRHLLGDCMEVTGWAAHNKSLDVSGGSGLLNYLWAAGGGFIPAPAPTPPLCCPLWCTQIFS